MLIAKVVAALRVPCCPGMEMVWLEQGLFSGWSLMNTKFSENALGPPASHANLVPPLHRAVGDCEPREQLYPSQEKDIEMQGSLRCPKPRCLFSQTPVMIFSPLLL